MFSAVAIRLRAVLDGFWLLPALVAFGFAALALVLVRVDRDLREDHFGFTFDGDAGAARGVLETIAGSLITVAGLTFSLTVVVLVLVSGQFTPRSVPLFLADRINQVTAGTFIGLFVYCLLVLRTVRGADESGIDAFVPRLSVTVAVVLAVLAIGLLLYFIHHLGDSIQASTIVRRIGSDTLAQIDKLPTADASGPPTSSDEPGVVRPTKAGYVRYIALDDIAEHLDEASVVHLPARIGTFVTEEQVLAQVWPAAAAAQATDIVRQHVAIGSERGLHHDVLYGIRQLAEIAMKGLSPGVNDPTTAESAIGYMRAILERLAQQPLPAAMRHGRVTASLHTFDDYVHGAFDQVGRYASSDPRVVVTLLDSLSHIAEVVRRAGRNERMTVLRKVAECVAEHALEDARTARDRELIRVALTRMREQPGAGAPD